MDSSAAPPMPSLVSTSSLAVIVLFAVLATATVGLRLYSRNKFSKLSYGADDYFIIFALVFTWGLFITAVITAAIGGVDYVKGDPLAVASFYLKIFFAEPLLEFPGQTCMRISVLLFYKKIFVTKKFQLVCWFFIGVVAAWGLCAVIVDLTGANPIWEAWDPLGHWNIDFGSYSIAIGGIGIALDVVTVVLPLPVIHKLHMKLRTKILTAGILWLGIFCVVADSVRLYYTVVEINLALSEDGVARALAGRSVWLWDRIAPSSSIIAACLPTYGHLLRSHAVESIIRSATSWLSFHSNRGSRGSNRSNGKQKHMDGTADTDSQKDIRAWERLHDDKGTTSAHVGSEAIPLEDLPSRPELRDGVQVTSTVDLKYSRQSASDLHAV